ncbi:MAG: RNA polymerase-associated protein RapA [Oligoflexales bacterium]
MHCWVKGQRVVSRTEPELGLGFVADVSETTICIQWSQDGEGVRYGHRGSPLQRIELQPGHTALTQEGLEIIVQDVQYTGGLAYYSTECGRQVCETDLDVLKKHSTPIDQWLDKSVSSHIAYDLRQEGWELRAHATEEEIRGLVGPRVTPLAHQLYLARTVANRQNPRVLLADEVGLGKTIEACLIFSALKSMGRAQRVLVITPPALVNQWCAELYRKFNELFSIVDAEAMIASQEALNMDAFQAHQKVIVSLPTLKGEALEQAVSAGWDLVIVDESHHLKWSQEEGPGPQWKAVQRIGDQSKALLLLTATPKQRGLVTQFGLLHLVDPILFSNFEEFALKADWMSAIAGLARQIIDEGVDDHVRKSLQTEFPDDVGLMQLLEEPNPDADHVLAALVDRHGTGRVLFRNRRTRIQGFPKRVLHSVPLQLKGESQEALEECSLEELDAQGLMSLATGRASFVYDDNPRFEWLKKFLEDVGEKVLVICHTEAQVQDLQLWLRQADVVDCAVFHEGLSELERDRQAARFAEASGPRVLICSEIGGEGRNFQFVHHLVLLDLPKHPDLLEQRIGRLDRIGQKNDVDIWVPWVEGTAEEVLFRWYNEGLNGFSSAWNGADVILTTFIDELWDFLEAWLKGPYADEKPDLSGFLQEVNQAAQDYRAELAKGADVLVDLNSFKESDGDSLLEKVEDCDDNPNVELFMRGMLDYLGFDYEDYDDRGSLLVKPSSLSFVDAFPGLEGQQDDVVMAFDRDLAIVREEVFFLTQDHPLVEGALNFLLDRADGAASFCRWKKPKSYAGRVFTQFLFVLVPRDLKLSGPFLPPQCFEVCLDHEGKIVKGLDFQKDPSILIEEQIPDDVSMWQPLLSKQFEMATELVHEKREECMSLARAKLAERADEELQRLESLQQMNPLVSEKETQTTASYYKLLREDLEKAELRLDAVRVITTL